MRSRGHAEFRPGWVADHAESRPPLPGLGGQSRDRTRRGGLGL